MLHISSLLVKKISTDLNKIITINRFPGKIHENINLNIEVRRSDLFTAQNGPGHIFKVANELMKVTRKIE